MEIQLQMSWKKTVSSKSCFSTVLLFKKNTTASSKMYAFLTDRRREKKTLGYVPNFFPHQKNFEWQMKLTGKLSSSRNFSKTLTSQYQFKSTQWAHNNEYAHVKHAQSDYSSKVIVFISIHRIRKTMRKRYVWTRIFLKPEKKSCVFKRIRIRVDGANSH